MVCWFVFIRENETVDFSESGWNKMLYIWTRCGWKKKVIRESDGENLARVIEQLKE